MSTRIADVPVWETALVFAIACAINLSYLDHTPQWDELYHALAARSWLADGSLRIADGVYNRAWLFTWLVSRLIDPDQLSLAAARIPAALAGAGLVALLFRFTAQAGGRLAGWIAALLLATLPLGIYLSQIVRFYTLHALLFMIASIAVYRIVLREGTLARRVLGLLWAAALLALAYHLQDVTLIGVGGLALFAAIELGPPLLRPALAARRYGLIALLAVLSVAGALALLASGVLDGPLAKFTTAPFWALETVNDRRVYDRFLVASYPALWTLLPVGILLALRRQRDFTLLCACVFGFGFLAHSVAAAKEPRYLYHVLPFFFALSGIAVAEAIPLLRKLVGDAARVLLGEHARPSLISSAETAGILVAAAFLIFTNPAFRDSARMVVLSDADWDEGYRWRGFPDWEGAREQLRPLADQADVLLSSCGLATLYYLDRLDYDVSGTLRQETDTKQEFGIDPKTGRPVISTPESLDTLMARHPSGLVVIERRRWRYPYNVPAAFADELEARTERVPFPDRYRLMVFKWGKISSPPDSRG